MKQYVGTKIIKADDRIKTWKEHYEEQGWHWPEGKEGADRLGYTVGYPNAQGEFDGDKKDGCHYISWSPADVFEATYKPIE